MATNGIADTKAPPPTSDSISQASPVTVSLEDLQESTIPFSTLESAFGLSSLGIIVVSDLPAEFLFLRHKLLTYASHLASLPPSILESLVSAEAKYLVGWSHGRETLPPKSLPDFHKGSYYVNCAFYQASKLQAAPKTAAFPDFPEYTSDNIWPPEELIPEFRKTFEELVSVVIDVAVLVARNVDRYAVEKVDGYAKGYLEGVVRGSFTTKARLLHYFPPSEAADTGEDVRKDSDDWCATHLDHGCLTGLLSAMYLPSGDLPTLPDLPEGIPCPDPTAGLYIHSREGQAVKVSFPADTLAFQTGEALQKITNGKFRAVPHYVSPGKIGGPMKGIERNTLAVFTQPNLEDVVDLKTGECFGGFAKGIVDRNTTKER